ncbi:MAG: aminoacyl-tRNA hydrolase [Verrucomicrobia bacterium]|nr:aminoacyl-tRNA hydrolase [Verrucomicrobiota bacterium]
MSLLRLVAGLGNPGQHYADTRHNVGFMVIEDLASREGIKFSKSGRWNSEIAQWGEILLIKPLTFMNRSGEAIGGVSRYHRIHPDEILVVVDDVALPVGRLRLRPYGSDGGHNGLKSIVEHLGESFMRLRIGVGSAETDLIEHVLGKFSITEGKLIGPAIERATRAIKAVAEEGIAAAMNTYNKPETC